MAITNIEIVQDNLSGNVNLLAIHNPLCFIANVSYTHEAPEEVDVEIHDDTELLDTFKAIPYADLTSSQRQFLFFSDDFLRGFADSFDDYFTTEKTIEPVPNITKYFKIKFTDGAASDECEFYALHGARQFSETPAVSEVYTNVYETYFSGENMPVYIYFYNSSEENEISAIIDGGTLDNDYALDYDETPFADFDGFLFRI